MTTPPGGPSAAPSATGTTTAAHRLDEFLKSSTTFVQDQLGRWTGILQKVRAGTYDSKQGLQDAVGMLDAWLDLATVPFQSATGREKQLPTLLFVVDGDAEFSPPGDAPTHIFLPPGITPEVSDLYRVGDDILAGGPPASGSRTISAQAHVRARLSPERDRVVVTLVDIGRGKSVREQKGIFPGLYAGAVFAREGSERRPLAIICALVEESTLP
ncbi:hypothetical protein [Archangium violaceum]|uniref:Uncharacterized protein n=1 Tax=Archangium violaceum Cb vi76 TaxID=1406225 RepID=A0A084SGZ3_9BACT|nr:hypothetical protein [Archangium violaceum]KFA87728.1 hypothetical protein Q664_45815 [Archangium violaceum Cb vi76]